MFIELFLLTLAGILIGMVTGITPGLHVNTVALLLMPLAGAANPYFLACLIIAVAVSHSFFDFIPSLLLGAPDPETALSVLPGHRLLHAGRGYEAVAAAVTGGIMAMLASTALLPLLLAGMPVIYGLLCGHIGMILVIVSAALVLTENGWKKLSALAIFLLSGILGTLTFNSPLLSSDVILFPIFTGLFGISSMLFSMQSATAIPQQRMRWGNIKNRLVLSGTLKGLAASIVLGILPGLGAAQASSVAQFSRAAGRDADRGFILTVGAIGTAVTVFSILSLYTISKARSGAAAAVGSFLDTFGTDEVLMLVAVSLLSAGIAAILTLAAVKRALAALAALDYRKLSLGIIGFLLLATAIFTSWGGLLILLTATSIGMLAPLFGVKRSNCMGVLMLPLILFYFGM
ncbi:MAG: tripartite tricarboxylate transporter permease [Candidatus Aenigmarchaeota archaeon]|nr:tripartite tricarboxylate transporter permease [Candidatus Aenigmarchaeota archaeon]